MSVMPRCVLVRSSIFCLLVGGRKESRVQGRVSCLRKKGSQSAVDFLDFQFPCPPQLLLFPQIRAGATLLYDSEPELEEAETELKASAMIDAVKREDPQPGSTGSEVPSPVTSIRGLCSLAPLISAAVTISLSLSLPPSLSHSLSLCLSLSLPPSHSLPPSLPLSLSLSGFDCW